MAAAATAHGVSPVPFGGSQSPLRLLARTGLYDTGRYASPSEARMAVLNHFAACGWTLDQVRLELGGQFPGLAALYTDTDRQERLLDKEWAEACRWIQKRETRQRAEGMPVLTTQAPQYPQGGPAEPAAKLLHTSS